ncbi:HD-GYP domain-containing protein [Niallia sp. Krafla_26]|uniref:HD-GYP domain-containing protein n=1 Tax=Niallia sp. Krafla_26 TaxID=3064703 RepID=UPI003D185C1A
MRLVKTTTVRPGTRLGKAIYNDNGKVLVNKGVSLEERILKRLNELNITYIYIDDKQTEGIEFKDPISPQLRQEAVTTIKTTLKSVIDEPISSKSFVLEKSVKQYQNIIRNIISELDSNSELMSILSDVCIHDNYIFTHSLNVTLYSLAVGMELNLKPAQLETVGLGSILHDIGKVTVPKEILLKPGRLTDQEFDVIKTHTTEGFDILRNSYSVPLLVAHCAFQHHERLDGSGYPRGIKGQEIHDFAKLIAVSDVFDAVTSNRVYRSAMLPHEGLELLYAGVERQYELNVVKAFHKAVAIYPVGITVELNDGRKGVVVKQNAALSDRPIVRILEENGEQVEPYELNLEEKLSFVIIGCDTTFKEHQNK